MGLFGFTNKKVTTTKSAISNAEATAYVDGGNRPQINKSLQAYLEASSRLDTVIRTTASVASSASFLYGKDLSDGSFKKTNFKQADGLYLNDYQTESDWLFELFGTLLTYDKVLLVPEDSKYKYREGLIDWTIVPDDKFKANLGKNQTIESFTYTSSGGADLNFKYEDVIYITRNLTANNLIYAIPRLKALMKTIENIVGIHNFSGEYISSGGKNSIVMASDSLLGEDQIRAARSRINEFLSTNKPKALMLNSEKFSLSKISDGISASGVMDFMTELSNEVIKSFNMPSYLLGEYSSSTQGQTVLYANRTWFQISVKPLFNTLSLAFTRFFRDSFGIKNARVKFDFSKIELLEDDDTVKLSLVETASKQGLLSLDEGRMMMGWEPLNTDASKMHFVPAYLNGVYPVSFENFNEDVNRNMQQDGNAGTEDVPTGEGGEANEEGLGGRE